MVFGLGLEMVFIVAIIGLVLGFGLLKFNLPLGMVAGLSVFIILLAITLTALGQGQLSNVLEQPLLASIAVFGSAFIVGEGLSALF